MPELSQHLIAEGYLEKGQIDLLNNRSALMGGTIDQHALEMGLIGVDEVISAYAECIKLPSVRPLDLDRLSLQRSAAFPLRLAARWRFIPVEQIGLSWQVLSDQNPTKTLREEVRKTLGVEVLARAIPTFLFKLLRRWLEQQPVDDELALLTARLYPRFSVSPNTATQAPQRTAASTLLEPSHLSYRLANCANGKQALSIVSETLNTWALNHEVWRIQGPILKTDQRALTIDSIDGLSERLDQDDVAYLSLTDPNWAELCSQDLALKTLALRPIHIHTRRVALLVIGSQSTNIDERMLARLDETAATLTKALESQLI